MNRREYLLSALATVGGGYMLWDIGVLSAPDGVEVPEVSAAENSTATRTDEGKTSSEPDSGGGVLNIQDWSKTERLTHKKVNEFRASEGKNELRWSPALSDMADAWAQKMADENQLEHRPEPAVAANSFGAQCMGVGENIGQTFVNERVEIASGTEVYNTPEQLADGLVKMWKNSSGHRENMLRIEYTQSGVGVHVADDNTVWAVQNFC
jgi:uncharacterized protein YkwD